MNLCVFCGSETVYREGWWWWCGRWGCGGLSIGVGLSGRKYGVGRRNEGGVVWTRPCPDGVLFVAEWAEELG